MGKPWEEVRREEPLNEARVALYQQVMEAQELIGAMRAVDVGQAAIDAALAESASPDPENESDKQLYVRMLTRYIEALGGRAVALETVVGIRAEFPGWSIAIPRFRR
jgi:KaiC/GvpD/RAD55 family RecA-like ATPase